MISSTSHHVTVTYSVADIQEWMNALDELNGMLVNSTTLMPIKEAVILARAWETLSKMYNKTIFLGKAE